ncbi:MAG: GAF domain-containing protein [Chloroflexota bacterium]
MRRAPREQTHNLVFPPTHRQSLARRMAISALAIFLLVASALAGGYWYTSNLQNSVNTIQQSAELSQSATQLQFQWNRLVETIDSLLLTRSTSSLRSQLQQAETDFNQSLQSLSEQSMGLTSESMAVNQEILAELRLVSQEMSGLLEEFSTYATSGRWGSALTLRQTRLAELQRRLEKLLDELGQNIQADIAAASQATQRSQQATRIFWGIAAVLTLFFLPFTAASLVRDIVQPITQLIERAQRIAAAATSTTEAGRLGEARLSGDAFTALERQDEIGDLARAFNTMTERLNLSYETLEQRVVERTAELQQRTNQMEVAAQVARDITINRNLETLLEHAVNLIRERFGFYHAGIFLVDENNDYAILRSATGQAGAELLRRGHKLKIGETGLVGYAAQSGEARIASNVDQDAAHFKNPLLPHTRAEAVLPLKVGERVTGALDVQSQEPQAFDEQSLTVLQIIADQLATAIESARLFQELQFNLRQVEQLYAGYSRQVWERFTQTSPFVGYEFDGMHTRPLEVGSASNVGEEERPHSSTAPLPALFPLELRGEQVGSLQVWGQSGQLPAADIQLLANLSQRLSQVLESARLFNEAQARAQREQNLNRLTASLVRSLDTEGVLQTAAIELGQLPSILEASIYLSPEIAEGDEQETGAQRALSPQEANS